MQVLSGRSEVVGENRNVGWWPKRRDGEIVVGPKAGIVYVNRGPIEGWGRIAAAVDVRDVNPEETGVTDFGIMRERDFEGVALVMLARGKRHGEGRWAAGIDARRGRRKRDAGVVRVAIFEGDGDDERLQAALREVIAVVEADQADGQRFA